MITQADSVDLRLGRRELRMSLTSKPVGQGQAAPLQPQPWRADTC